MLEFVLYSFTLQRTYFIVPSSQVGFGLSKLNWNPPTKLQNDRCDMRPDTFIQILSVRKSDRSLWFYNDELRQTTTRIKKVNNLRFAFPKGLLQTKEEAANICNAPAELTPPGWLTFCKAAAINISGLSQTICKYVLRQGEPPDCVTYTLSLHRDRRHISRWLKNWPLCLAVRLEGLVNQRTFKIITSRHKSHKVGLKRTLRRPIEMNIWKPVSFTDDRHQKLPIP